MIIVKDSEIFKYITQTVLDVIESIEQHGLYKYEMSLLDKHEYEKDVVIRVKEAIIYVKLKDGKSLQFEIDDGEFCCINDIVDHMNFIDEYLEKTYNIEPELVTKRITTLDD